MEEAHERRAPGAAERPAPPRPQRARPAAAAARTAGDPKAPPLVVRVLPDIVTLDKAFDYAVPDAWHRDGRADRLAVGSIVRVRLAGRRLRGWVTEVGVAPQPGVELQPLAGLTGAGPTKDLMELAEWAAWRWAGRRVSLLRAASPARVVAARPAGAASARVSRPVAGTAAYDDVFEDPGAVTVARCAPAEAPAALVRAAVRRGAALIVVPALSDAGQIAAVLRRDGVRVALGTDDWARAAAGATVVGTRTAVWMPMPRLSAVVVLDEHDERLKSEHGPAWHARDVALERARRAGAPTALVSAVPSLEALEAGRLRVPGRAAERAGWPPVHILDRRRDDPARGGLFAEGLRHRLREPGRVAVVLNRKGRSRLLACKACGELVRSADGRVPMTLADAELVAADGSERRPVVCASCGSTTLRNLRMGVTRAREELAALAGEPVAELTAQTRAVGAERIVIGTEAVLWRLEAAASVVFLDFDRELLAPRQRVGEQALALLARAARLASRGGHRGCLVVQTRQPEHPVIQAAVRADPSVAASVEQRRRRSLGLPPYGAQALLSGAGAAEFAAVLRGGAQAPGSDEGAGSEMSVLGPRGGRYLLRSAHLGQMLDLLACTPRPAARLRVEVDPLRV